MHHEDRRRGQLGIRIELLQLGRVPALDLSKKDPGERRAVEGERIRGNPSRFTTGTMPPITIGHWMRSPSAASSFAVSGTSEAPKATVRAVICLIPPPEPIDW